MSKQIERFSFSPPNKVYQEGEWLLAVTSFEATSSVFIITAENNSFSIRIPCHWRIRNYLEEEIFDYLKNSQKLRTQNYIELHVEEVRKRGDKTKTKSKDFSLSDFHTSKEG